MAWLYRNSSVCSYYLFGSTLGLQPRILRRGSWFRFWETTENKQTNKQTAPRITNVKQILKKKKHIYIKRTTKKQDNRLSLSHLLQHKIVGKYVRMLGQNGTPKYVNLVQLSVVNTVRLLVEAVPQSFTN